MLKDGDIIINPQVNIFPLIKLKRIKRDRIFSISRINIYNIINAVLRDVWQDFALIDFLLKIRPTEPNMDKTL